MNLDFGAGERSGRRTRAGPEQGSIRRTERGDPAWRHCMRTLRPEQMAMLDSERA